MLAWTGYLTVGGLFCIPVVMLCSEKGSTVVSNDVGPRLGVSDLNMFVYQNNNKCNNWYQIHTFVSITWKYFDGEEEPDQWAIA